MMIIMLHDYLGKYRQLLTKNLKQVLIVLRAEHLVKQVMLEELLNIS